MFTDLTNDQRFLVSVNDILEKLPLLYDTSIPPLGVLQRENYIMWKNLQRENHVDLLLFLNLENYRFKFNSLKLNKYDTINETLLKVIMKDFGWQNIPDTVIDLAKRGYDPLRRRIYFVKDVMRFMVDVHSYALELYTNKNYRALLNIKSNKDPSRRFPDFNRRQVSSPRV